MNHIIMHFLEFENKETYQLLQWNRKCFHRFGVDVKDCAFKLILQYLDINSSVTVDTSQFSTSGLQC